MLVSISGMSLCLSSSKESKLDAKGFVRPYARLIRRRTDQETRKNNADAFWPDQVGENFQLFQGGKLVLE